MTQARAIRIREFGDADVMKIEAVDLAEPGPGEVRVRQQAVGFNFIDIYQRRGVYPIPLPTGLGHEAAGVVEAAGPGVEAVRPGDRVAYMNAGLGAYADLRNVPADRLVPLPPEMSCEQAAALLFKGLTAQYLLRKTYRVKDGDLVLVHAAAGGVGSILCRWAKALGATVVGTAGSREKCEIALGNGCDHVLDYSQDGWAARFLEVTGGRKAQVAYDSVGRDTFMASLDCIAPFGLMVVFGAASGPAPAIEPELLNKKGCLYLTRPSVFPHNAQPALLRENARDLFDAVRSGAVAVEIGARFPLDQAAEAHRAVEARRTTGAVLLMPD